MLTSIKRLVFVLELLVKLLFVYHFYWMRFCFAWNQLKVFEILIDTYLNLTFDRCVCIGIKIEFGIIMYGGVQVSYFYI